MDLFMAEENTQAAEMVNGLIKRSQHAQAILSTFTFGNKLTKFVRQSQKPVKNTLKNLRRLPFKKRVVASWLTRLRRIFLPANAFGKA